MELTVSGNTVFASTGGRALDRDAPLIVLIHGAGMDHSVWSLQTRYLAHHGRSVLAVDLPGHGRSGGEPLTTIEDLADWVPKLIDAAGFGQAALVGHSMGAITALEAATRHPERVRALALLGVAERSARLDAKRETVHISRRCGGVESHLDGSLRGGKHNSGAQRQPIVIASR